MTIYNAIITNGGNQMIEYILLGFLMERNMTGYDMKHYMSISTSYFIDASFGSIYPALKRLVQKGLIEGRESAQGGKLKKTYFICESGKAEFLKWLDSPIEPSKTSVSSTLAKVFFYRYLPTDRVQELITQYIQEMEKYKTDLLNLKGEIDGHLDEYERSTLDFGLDFYDFAIRWYENHFQSK